MKRPLIAFAFALVLAASAAATSAHAQARSPFGGATMPRDPVQADPLGPRSNPTTTVAAAVTRTQIERVGYTGVRGLQRGPDGTWHAVARDAKNAPVALTVDSQGQVSQAR